MYEYFVCQCTCMCVSLWTVYVFPVGFVRGQGSLSLVQRGSVTDGYSSCVWTSPTDCRKGSMCCGRFLYCAAVRRFLYCAAVRRFLYCAAVRRFLYCAAVRRFLYCAAVGSCTVLRYIGSCTVLW